MITDTMPHENTMPGAQHTAVATALIPYDQASSMDDHGCTCSITSADPIFVVLDSLIRHTLPDVLAAHHVRESLATGRSERILGKQTASQSGPSLRSLWATHY